MAACGGTIHLSYCYHRAPVGVGPHPRDYEPEQREKIRLLSSQYATTMANETMQHFIFGTYEPKPSSYPDAT